MAGAERYGINNEKRDIPTESEVRSLLNLDWRNHLGKLAFELAAYCGLRAGEISGLRVCDLDMQAELLHIRHSWNEKDGLKSTKNTEERDVPVTRELLLQLMNRARLNPNFLYRLAREKKIPHVNYGRHIIFRKSDLYNWLGSMVCPAMEV